jgi:hypothetical protein
MNIWEMGNSTSEQEGILEDSTLYALIGVFMKQQLEQRLKELRAEYASGQKTLVELENKQTAVKATLLRISSAIQVLEKELSNESKQ